MDIFQKCDTDQGNFGTLRAAGDRCFTRPTLSPKPGRIMQSDGKPLIMWSVNNYLGLANHPEVQKVAEETIRTYGVSAPMGSRMMSGTTEHHLAFEEALAEFSQKEAAYLFNYGYMGVLGIVSALVGKKDIVIMDKLAHACIVDAAFLSQATVRVFRHNNPDSLESILKRLNHSDEGGVMIITEGVYGMTGDLAPLPDIVALKNKYKARLFIDDAHGCGVIGEKGRGTADHFGVQDDIDIYFGTFAKSFAGIGGFGASFKNVIEWIGYNARTQVFAKSLPMIYVKTMQKMLELIESGDALRSQLWKTSNALKEGLKNAGYFIGPGHSPICSVFLPLHGSTVEEIAGRTVSFLRKAGVFVSIVAYPVIPMGLCMFRLIPTVEHLPEDVETTVQQFIAMRDALKLDMSFNATDLEKIQQLYGKNVVI